MKLYKKRIAFLISDQHLVPHGGIGQFAKGFIEMSNKLNWKVDVILDKAPTGGFSRVIEDLNANLIFSKEFISYGEHTSTFVFSDSINFEKMINFRKSIVQALQNNLYDCIVCNSMEAMPAVYALDIGHNIPIVFYTHEESMVFRHNRKFKGVFTESCNDFFNRLMTVDYAFAGTQSSRNLEELKNTDCNNATLLPMPMSERDLLIPNYGERSGVLFIGRWEDRKNPEAYLEVIKKTDLPAKIITNSNGKRKFEARLAELNISNYEIRAGVIGKEKVDFIKSARVYFNPSLRESYSYTFFECLGHMPCVVLNKSDWVANFDKKFYTMVSLENAAEEINNLYNSFDVNSWYNNGALDYVKMLDESTKDYWINFIDNFTPTSVSKSNSAKINEFNDIEYATYLKSLNRKNIAIEDIKSVLTNKHKYNIIYTDGSTYLSKDKFFVPKEKQNNSLEDLFT